MRTLAKRCYDKHEFWFKIYEPVPGIAQRLNLCPSRKLFSMTVDELRKSAGGDVDMLVDKLIGGKMSDGTERLHSYSVRQLSEPDFL